MSAEAACVTLLNQLKQEFAKENANLSLCEDLLYQLKVCYISIILNDYLICLVVHVVMSFILQIKIADKLLPIAGNVVNQKDLILARDVLEIGTRLAVRAEDTAAFERNIAQLKCYYYDYKLVFVFTAYLF